MSKSDYQYDAHYSNNGGRDLKPRDFFSGSSNPVDFDEVIKESEARIAATIAADKPVILSVEDLAKIAEIQYLHDIALARAMKRDGHSKSGEGAMEISLGNSWQRMGAEDEDGDAVEIGVSLYAYVLGPNRNHWFASIDRALETVRVWYAQEFSSPETSEWDLAED